MEATELRASSAKIAKMFAEIKTYRIPGEEQENKRAPIVWKLDYDVTHAARFESMKNAGRHKHLYRIHRDLTKIAERRIRAFDRGQRMFNSEVNWSAHKVVDRMKRLKERSECVNKTLKMKYSYNSDDWPGLIDTIRGDKDKFERRPREHTFISENAYLVHDVESKQNKTHNIRRSRDNHSAQCSNKKVLPVQRIVVQKGITL